MAIRGKTVIVCSTWGDVRSVTVERGVNDLVTLGVNDGDSDDSADGLPLIVGYLQPIAAIALARALLIAAGVEPARAFID